MELSLRKATSLAGRCRKGCTSCNHPFRRLSLVWALEIVQFWKTRSHPRHFTAICPTVAEFTLSTAPIGDTDCAGPCLRLMDPLQQSGSRGLGSRGRSLQETPGTTA